MNILIMIVGILLTIFIVIGSHEASHFFAARLLGIKVLRFSIGFGKTLWKCTGRSGTEYIFALIPLGGYVQMLDEREGDVTQNERHLAFNRQPFYKKAIVILAGPLSNILLAFILYWLIFLIGFTSVKPIIGEIIPHSIAQQAGLKSKQEIIGIDGEPVRTWNGIELRMIAHVGNPEQLKIETRQACLSQQPCSSSTETKTLDLSNWHLDGLTPDPLKSLGFTPYQPSIPLVIGFIKQNSPADIARLQLGDKIISVNHVPIKNWENLINFIVAHPDTAIKMQILRYNKPSTITVTIGSDRNLFLQKSGYLGIGPNFTWPKELLQKIQYNPIDSISHAYKTIIDFTRFNIVIFGKMLTGKLSLQSLGGPIMIFESAGNALNAGIIPFLGFLAFLSVSVGIINLIPIPGLDGGHLFIHIVELIIGKPLPENLLLLLFRLGFIFLFLILIQTLVNDIMRLS
jgi:regulator of sigma E protease